MTTTSLVYGDLHRHLEGAIHVETVAELAAERGLLTGRGPVRELVSTAVPLDDLLEYLAKIEVATTVAVEARDWERIGFEAVEDAAVDGLSHVELRYSPFYIRDVCGIPAEEVMDAVADGVARAQRQYEIPVALIGVLLRNFGPDVADRELSAILARRNQFRAIDIAGDEAGVPADLFAPHYERAREAGLRTTAHAGEAAGPESVRAALEHLRPERIGHGVRSVEDPALLETLAQRGITLEVAVTSNVHTAAAKSFADHQLKSLLSAGVPVALSTDDPVTSRTKLSNEYRIAEGVLGLTPAELESLARCSRQSSFADLADPTR
ncbi:adenosine deaminase [Streptomyces malaysiensis]|uniref:adenosine deaminase n=1 Tax=Streptomyces malaysiensis TaxID=92644 RepID=UPI003710EE53